MPRLLSTFPNGVPALGLMLLRLTVGVALIEHGITAVLTQSSFIFSAFHGLLALAGVLLIVGLWTPIIGALAAVSMLWDVFAHSVSWRQCVLIAVMAAALALLGPGAWSIDSRLYGWKRIRIPNRKHQNPPI